jgi:hypothetical protein
MQQEIWAELSEQERGYVSSMYADMTRPDLSLAEKQALFVAYEEVRGRFLKLRELWKGLSSSAQPLSPML